MSEAAEPIKYRVPPSHGQDADFLMPVRWTFDGDYRRRAPVFDRLNGNRVARIVGYKRCLLCKSPFWSEDVRNVHVCDGYHAHMLD